MKKYDLVIFIGLAIIAVIFAVSSLTTKGDHGGFVPVVSSLLGLAGVLWIAKDDYKKEGEHDNK